METGNAHIHRLAASPDVKGVVLGLDAHSAISPLLWRPQSGKPAQPLESVVFQERRLPIGADTYKAGFQIQSIAFSPDGRVVAMTGQYQSTDDRRVAYPSVPGPIVLWDTATGKELGQVPPADGTAWVLACSPDGRTLAAASTSRIHLLDVASRKTSLTLDCREKKNGFEYFPVHLAFTPDGRNLVAVSTRSRGGAQMSGKVRVWKLVLGE